MEDKKNTRQFITKLLMNVFEGMFFTLILFFIAEIFKKGLITNYFSFNLLLTLTLFFGIIVLVFGHQEELPRNGKGRFLIRLIQHAGALIFACITGWMVYQMVSNAYNIFFILPWAIGVGVYIGFYLAIRK